MNSLLLTEQEISLLYNLVGQNLRKVEYDHWSAQLHLDRMVISIQPDEISMPTDYNPYGDIVTLRIGELRENSPLIVDHSVLIDCGQITDIFRLESLVEIEVPMPVEAWKLLGVEVPAGLGWSNIIFNPNGQTQKTDLPRTLLGLQFETDQGLCFTFYSNTMGYFVRCHQGCELPDTLKDRCAKIKIKTAL